MRNKRSINHVCFEAQIHEAKAVQISVKAGRVGGFLLRALMAALVLFSARHGETAELKKFTLGYSTVGVKEKFASPPFFSLHRVVRTRGGSVAGDFKEAAE